MKKYFSIVFVAVFVLFGIISYNNALAIVVLPSPVTNFAGSGASGGGFGSSWSNPERIYADDDSYSTSSISQSYHSETLDAKNFGFHIPTDATIKGIQVTIGHKSRDTNSIKDRSIYLLKNSIISGDNNADTTTYWPTTETAASYGSTSSLWGTTWTVDQINSSNFGVLLSVDNNNSSHSRTASVDYIKITITYKTAQTITFGSLSDKTFGASDFSISATATSSLPITFASQTTGVCTVSGSSVHIVTAGICTIRASQSGNDTYDSAPNVDRNFTINRATPTLSISNPSIPYNGSQQAVVISNSVVGNVSDVKYNGSSTVPTNAGVYAITADFTPTDTTDYSSLHHVSVGNFTITKIDAEISVAGYTGPYDTNEHGITGSATGAEGVDLSASLNLGSKFKNVPGGLAHWTFTGGTNYNSKSGDISITINAIHLTVNATGISKIHDGNATATVVLGSNNIISGEDVTLSYGSATYNSALPEDDGSNVGADKPITVIGITMGGTAIGNYILNNTTTNTAANISPEASTITLDGETSVPYDGKAHELTATVNEGLHYIILYNGLTTKPVQAGTYTVFAFITDPNFAGQTSKTLTINKIGVTVTADHKTKVYGEADPELTYTHSEMVTGDGLTGSLTRDIGGDVGTYAIKQGTLGNPNYTIAYEGDNLVITKASQTITFDPINAKLDTDPDFKLGATSDSELPITYSVEGDGVCSLIGVGNDTIHILGIGDCTVTAYQVGDDNYNKATDVSQKFTIAKLTHTINATAGENGSISPSGSVAVADGSNKEFTITPNSDYRIANVIVDEISKGSINTYTFEEVTSNHSISVTFERIQSSRSGDYVPGYGPSSQSGGGTTQPPTNTLPSVTPPTTPSTGGQVLGAEKYNFTKTLRMGSTGDEVKELQKLLNSLGFDCGPVDGKFGIKTKQAVMKFQAANEIKVTGIVGIITRAALNR